MAPTTRAQPYNGIFKGMDDSSVGHLVIDGRDSLATILGQAHWKAPATELRDVHGALNNGLRASLLDCVVVGQTQHRFDARAEYETRLLPNYVVLGEEHIRSGEAVIRAVSYHLDNIDVLVRAPKTFKSLHATPEEARSILAAAYARTKSIADENGWPLEPFDPEIGEHPTLLYFSGVWEIIACEAQLGRISLVNRSSEAAPSAAGIRVDNQVAVVITFAEPKTLDQTIQALRTLHSLFELSLGKRQRYQWIELELTHVKNATRGLHQTAQLYWSMCNTRVSEPCAKANLGDVLVSPDFRPAEFAKVVAAWMDTAPVMRDPRERFATAFFGQFGVNRIVGAANLFDLLPESHAPARKALEPPVAAAVAQCRAIMQSLPDSFARQSVLSALGRVGSASLRDKIYHRADRIIALAGEKLPELHLPCAQAVICRNHYVHGSPAAFDYQAHITEFAFITETLEFVFACSDLIELGWDFIDWMAEGTTMTHPFGAYLIAYRDHLERLKRVIGA